MPHKSLVTVEVRDNEVVQARIKNNEKTTKKQNEFLDIWQKRSITKTTNNSKERSIANVKR